MRISWRVGAIWVLIIVGLMIVLVTATPQGRAGAKAAIVIAQILPNIPLQPQTWFTPVPVREAVHYPVANGVGTADLYYRPGNGPYPGVMLFFGVNPAGRDDPRVVRLAEGLARSGMVVFVPWSQNMVEKRIDVRDIDDLVHAFQYLHGLNIVDSTRVGMGGFCVGSSMLTVAAEDLRINEDVAFINFFGGYYRLSDLLVAVASHQSFYGDSSDAWQPGSLTREVFVIHLIDGIDRAEDREILRQIFVDGEETMRPRRVELSPEGDVVFRLLNGVPTIAETEQLVLRLPIRVRDTLDALSPATHIDRLKARMLIMHDRDDNLVPSEESRRLVDAVDQQVDVYHSDFLAFQHMDFGRPVSFPTYAKDLGKLFLHLYQVIRSVS